MPGGKPFQSKLIPFLELIQRLRKKRMPYPEIAKILQEEHGIEVGATTIFDFVKVRSRRNDVYAIAAEPPSSEAPETLESSRVLPAIPASPASPAKPPAPENRQEKLAAAKAAIAARRLAAEQTAAAEGGGWAEFQRSFDPTKPLKLINPNNTDPSNSSNESR
jgi:hypothetical protein